MNLRKSMTKFAAMIGVILGMASAAVAETVDIGALFSGATNRSGTGWNYTTPYPNQLEILDGANITVTGGNNNDMVFIYVDDNATVNITLQDAHPFMMRFGNGDQTGNFTTNATITLLGTNVIPLIENFSGTINGSGSLITDEMGGPNLNINGGTITVGNSGLSADQMTVSGGTLTVNNITGFTQAATNLTVSGGTVTVGTISGTTNHTGGTLNGVVKGFGTPPRTGLSDLTWSTLLMLIFTLLSVALWGCVISRRLSSVFIF